MLESAGCYLLKSLLYKLGVQHIPSVEVCLFFHHLHVFLSANSKLPVSVLPMPFMRCPL